MSYKQTSVEEIREWLLENIADRLEMSPEQIDPSKPLTDYGMSSREAIMLSGELEEWLEFELPPELFYDYPQINQLAEVLAKGPTAFEEAADQFASSGGSAQETGLEEMVNELSYTSYVDLLEARAAVDPDRLSFVYLKDGETEAGQFTFRSLSERAKAIGAYLQQRGLEGERVLLLYPSSLDFVAGFIGCLYAGAIAVPAFPPVKRRGIERIATIVEDCGAAFALVTTELLSSFEKNKRFRENAQFQGMNWIKTDTISNQLNKEWEKPALTHATLAFLQYTSGSTGQPKGVMVSHGNILDNCRAMREGYQAPDGCVTVSWLPLFHDMGLIGHVLGTLNFFSTVYFMQPTDFLQKPIRWLQAVSKYKAHFSTGPNFAFQYCVDRIPVEQRQGLDLSSWKVAINGSEPVRAETIEAFVTAFQPFGFQPETMHPSFGMAEATLFVTGAKGPHPPRVMYIDGAGLEKNTIEEVPVDHERAVGKVSCGQKALEELIIVNPDTFTALPEGQVGEVWVKGRSVAEGYWQKPEVTRQIFQAYLKDSGKGPYLRTGDLGYLKDEELYFTGRLKDLIIIRGHNHYPQDIEKTLYAAHEALTTDGAAAFTVDAGREERLVIVAEVERTALQDLDAEAVMDAIRAIIAREHDIQVYAISLLSPGRLPRTTSGKTQRRAAKFQFLQDELVTVATWQLALGDLEPTPEPAGPMASSWQSLELEERQASALEFLKSTVAQMLHLPPTEVPLDKPVVNLGLDSMHAIEIKGRIEAALGVEVDVTRFMEGVNLQELSRELAIAEPRQEVAKTKAPPVQSANGIEEGSENWDIDSLTEEQIRELLTDLDSLSSEQVEQLLNKLSD